MSKEYIEREAFDNALCEAMKKHNPYDSCESKIMSGLLEAQELLDEAPAADVVEVVRCGKCKHITPVEGGLPLCTLHNAAVAYNDYCSYSKRGGADNA